MTRGAIREFLDLEFGMFLHYNMATYKDRQWVEGYVSPAEFDPGGPVDTDAWADAAVSAGMTYGVLTAKHVAGFCLWDSAHTTYGVMHPDCPHEGDLVAQFVESFTSRGLKAGLYYCWRNPGFDEAAKKQSARLKAETGQVKTFDFKVLPPECDPATHSLDEQIEFQKLQIAELMRKYPDVFYIWNDGLDPEIMPADEWLEFARSVRPDVVHSANWWDWGKKGTPYLELAVTEGRHFPEDNAYPGETCWCLEDSWFWGEGWKPKAAATIVGALETANARNANLLLNTGPDRGGRLLDSSIEALAEIGRLRAAAKAV